VYKWVLVAIRVCADADDLSEYIYGALAIDAPSRRMCSAHAYPCMDPPIDMGKAWERGVGRGDGGALEGAAHWVFVRPMRMRGEEGQTTHAMRHLAGALALPTLGTRHPS